MVENGRASKFVEDAQRKQSFIYTEMGSKKYTELLQDVVITFMENNVETELIFQQINSTIHVSKEAKEWFQGKEINLLDWPACSPDCNLIENLWSILASRVYPNSMQFKTVSELKERMKTC